MIDQSSNWFFSCKQKLFGCWPYRIVCSLESFDQMKKNKTNKLWYFLQIRTLPWLFFSPLPLIFARSVLWVCHVDSPQIENPSNLSNFLSVQLLNHDFKKKSLWEPPAVTMKNIIHDNPNISVSRSDIHAQCSQVQWCVMIL